MMITHDLGVVAGIAARVQVMYGGTIVESGPVGDIFAEPRMPYTIGLLGSVPNPELLGKPLTPDPRLAAVAAAPAAGLHVRPALPAGRAGVPEGRAGAGAGADPAAHRALPALARGHRAGAAAAACSCAPRCTTPTPRSTRSRPAPAS